MVFWLPYLGLIRLILNCLPRLGLVNAASVSVSVSWNCLTHITGIVNRPPLSHMCVVQSIGEYVTRESRIYSRIISLRPVHANIHRATWSTISLTLCIYTGWRALMQNNCHRCRVIYTYSGRVYTWSWSRSTVITNRPVGLIASHRWCGRKKHLHDVIAARIVLLLLLKPSVHMQVS